MYASHIKGANAKKVEYDFRSDTVTYPTEGMKAAMISAPVGDDVFRDDPTVIALEEYVAELAGHEAALFVPTGTMSNQICIRVHLTQPPHTIAADYRSHILNYEAGGAAFYSQAQIIPIHPLPGCSYLTAAAIEPHLIVDDDVHYAPTRLIELENTLGGEIMPIDAIKGVRTLAQKYDMKLHLDGARLWNACVVSGHSLKDYCILFDSVSLCFSKGLGAPVGSILVGSAPFVKKARHIRKLFGGGMRQSGVLAAAGSYAIEHHWPKMKLDHENAQYLSAQLSRLGFQVTRKTETNMVWFDEGSTGVGIDEIQVRAAEQGIAMLVAFVWPQSITLRAAVITAQPTAISLRRVSALPARILYLSRPPLVLVNSSTHRFFASIKKTKKQNMPPKKQAAPERVLLGRPSNNLKLGIVGLPNVGKSSFFNALTNSSVPAENFPYCTIDPSESRVAVPDPRFDWLCDFYKPASKVPAWLTVFDIAGLTKGAHEGQGLGNAFLSHIRAVDGIFHLTRAFDDSEIMHVEGEIDPVRDLGIIHEELRLKDEEQLGKIVQSKKGDVARLGGGGTAADKAKKEEFEILSKFYKHVSEDKKDIRQGTWSNKEIEVLNPLQLLTAKPVVYLCNLSERDYCRKKNKWLPKIKAFIDANYPGDILIPYSGILEMKLAAMETQTEKDAYLTELTANHDAPAPVQSALGKIVVTGYQALQLIYFFTAGPDEVRAWTIRKATKAPQAAGVIHTDFERTFIQAEVMKYDDLKELGSEAAVRAGGKYLMKGREYEVGDGDIMYFKAGEARKK
ncbi:threonine---tRNA ligase [Synchytrium endobioticum]|uniref:Obg-like ATPase 1 n=1 Tax=Synchytrium endobioticum TaxID=286115 RepID=A0A507D6G0_9FUNG|nr:threonine---tRNA ligase [Synchytrium endobioticum]TPX50646.1 threonine---tRNA ligase [Synchytrium endobioticum]